MQLLSDVLVAVFIVLCTLVYVTRPRRALRGLPNPPGPQGLPIVGNVRDMPTYHQWETFSRWGHEYGDLIYTKTFGTPVVVVNSIETARDLFEKRSSIYSSRPDIPMLTLMGADWTFGFMKYGARWRLHRKTFLRKFHRTAARAFQPIQTKWASVLLSRLKESPDDFVTHLRHFAGAVIMDVVYGIQVLPRGDPYIETAEKAMDSIADAATPGSFLIDLLPILRYIPEWVPGAGFQKKARLWRISITEMVEGPFRVVEDAVSVGTVEPSSSVIASLLATYSGHGSVHSDEENEAIRAAGASAYAAGSDTTNVALDWFIMAMVLYPEVQRKAQAELDSVIGMDRLPEFEDRQHLPYINALCKEIQRWNPVVPVGVAHATVEDDVYNGYLIPRGSVVIGNVWAMLHDETVFGPHVSDFEPERFLRPDVRDPDVAFGFGRRACPGRHMADNSIFIAVASILKEFNISHARDIEGNEIPVKPVCTVNAIARPIEYRCSIIPRTAVMEEGLFAGRKD
ncbi:cytochrome P450 [Ramaria rubella]|nr:cytochrome P450 [Ramaria rubella]